MRGQTTTREALLALLRRIANTLGNYATLQEYTAIKNMVLLSYCTNKNNNSLAGDSIWLSQLASSDASL